MHDLEIPPFLANFHNFESVQFKTKHFHRLFFIKFNLLIHTMLTFCSDSPIYLLLNQSRLEIRKRWNSKGCLLKKLNRKPSATAIMTDSDITQQVIKVMSIPVYIYLT